MIRWPASISGRAARNARAALASSVKSEYPIEDGSDANGPSPVDPVDNLSYRTLATPSVASTSASDRSVSIDPGTAGVLPLRSVGPLPASSTAAGTGALACGGIRRLPCTVT